MENTRAQKWMPSTIALLLTLSVTLVSMIGIAPSKTQAASIDLGDDLSDTESFDVYHILTAGDGEDAEDQQGQGYLGDTDNPPLTVFILDIINFITRIIGAFAMILIILGGLMMIVSEGDENRLQKGKGILEAAIIGLIISLMSYVIVRFVQSLFYLQ